MKEYYCPKCKWKLPTEKNIITMGMHILNKCFNCKSKLWDKKGNFLGTIKKIECFDCKHSDLSDTEEKSICKLDSDTFDNPCDKFEELPATNPISNSKTKAKICEKCGKLKIPHGTIIIDYEDFPCMCD